MRVQLPSLRSLLLLAAALAGVSYYVISRPPSLMSVAKGLAFQDEQGTMTYRGVSYAVEWGEAVQFEGNLRFAKPAHFRGCPAVTAHLLVTTGEYADSSIVSVTEVGEGTIRWEAPRNPSGTLVMLHVIPESPEIEAQVEQLSAGAIVRLSGRVEAHSKIQGSDGSTLSLLHSNHRFLRLSRVALLP